MHRPAHRSLPPNEDRFHVWPSSREPAACPHTGDSCPHLDTARPVARRDPRHRETRARRRSLPRQPRAWSPASVSRTAHRTTTRYRDSSAAGVAVRRPPVERRQSSNAAVRTDTWAAGYGGAARPRRRRTNRRSTPQARAVPTPAERRQDPPSFPAGVATLSRWCGPARALPAGERARPMCGPARLRGTRDGLR